jgi:chromate transporter
MIPLIRREVVDKHKWVAGNHFLELLTLAQSAPGPISLNAAVFVGYRARGWRGALSAISGIILPSFVIILLVAMFFSGIKDNHAVQAAFKGMRPAVVALIVVPIWSLAKGLGGWRIALAVLAAGTVWYFGITPIYFIIAGAVGGLVWTWYKRLKP